MSDTQLLYCAAPTDPTPDSQLRRGQKTTYGRPKYTPEIWHSVRQDTVIRRQLPHMKHLRLNNGSKIITPRPRMITFVMHPSVRGFQGYSLINALVDILKYFKYSNIRIVGDLSCLLSRNFVGGWKTHEDLVQEVSKRTEEMLRDIHWKEVTIANRLKQLDFLTLTEWMEGMDDLVDILSVEEVEKWRNLNRE
ncbi:uncharacterized protein I303_102015 [Kwoniella dejecticola CBS 10117]|uniref:Uncharacterized protein n=1 Tax=Kwoniella dejecticola CBS 10117 TaxID=1296121 RepID=A0A1A6AC56_9TREE|nr:uncharacterized protein I303_01847 [Kwoniella dejecticola CBS 10117]OBR87639.1 hypothetical protein I303_01847 [Kwoniella dejecticola CBS 10117]